jgi:hypothetical protein
MHIRGGCLCGEVHYEGEAEPSFMGYCHCVDCRRSSGGGHCAHIAAPAAGIAVTGNVATYDRPADSGNIVTRVFCPTCGAALYSTNAAMPGVMFLRASSLDDMEIFKPQMVVYASRRASWDKLDESLPHFDAMPPGM